MVHHRYIEVKAKQENIIRKYTMTPFHPGSPNTACKSTTWFTGPGGIGFARITPSGTFRTKLCSWKMPTYAVNSGVPIEVRRNNTVKINLLGFGGKKKLIKLIVIFTDRRIIIILNNV